MPSTNTIRRVYKPVVFILCLLPLLQLIAGAFSIAGVSLGADPVARVLHQLGEWGLRFLVITLAVTPLRFMLDQPWLLNFRRMFGLYAFTYVLLHFLTWLVLDQGLYWPGILEDIGKRPFITLGFAAFLMLIPLAVPRPTDDATSGQAKRSCTDWCMHRHSWRVAFLVAGEKGHYRAVDLRRYRCLPARLSLLAACAQAGGNCCRPVIDDSILCKTLQHAAEL
jgi:DMSO/TMAO reductase YedYZ heme-binding membrane subunit